MKALFPEMVVNSERLVTGVVGSVGYIVTSSVRYKKGSRWQLRKANYQVEKLRMSSQSGRREFGNFLSIIVAWSSCTFTKVACERSRCDLVV